VLTSATKEFGELAGVQLLREVSNKVHIPAFAIGGITLENLRSVLESGFARVAVQNAVWEAGNCGHTVKQFYAALQKA
jgi:thiamine-phosphate pyrophosphorylase